MEANSKKKFLPGQWTLNDLKNKLEIESELNEKIKINKIPLRNRTALTVDLLNPIGDKQIKAFQEYRIQSVQHFDLAMKSVAQLAVKIKGLPFVHQLPQKLLGMLLEPDGTAAVHVHVVLNLNGTNYTAITNEHGNFNLNLLKNHIYSGELDLKVHGFNAFIEVNIKDNQIAPIDSISSTGVIQPIILPKKIEPLPVSLAERLKELQSDLPRESTLVSKEKPEEHKKIILGEGDQCLTTYFSDYTVDAYKFGVFFRLIEPRTSTVSPAIIQRLIESGKYVVNGIFGALNTSEEKSFADESTTYIERVPVEQPISVDGFRDHVIGVGDTVPAIVSKWETVPMAGTLGLGYIVTMSQSWTPKGYALGNLVYSLPLAPGEQQRVAIFERKESASVWEKESLDVQEQQFFAQQNDSSTLAVVNSAFAEVAKGGSHFETSSSSESAGGGLFGLVSASGGSAHSSGDSSSWVQGARNWTQSAAEDSHAAVTREAAARRHAQRTSMRLASSNESENVTTQVITNHNHTRALTLQWWEVNRLYEVSTDVNGVTLVCLIPLELVRFLPPGQQLTLDTNSSLDKDSLLKRYSLLLKHSDLLARNLPREYQHGLTLLTEFASNPRTTVEAAGGSLSADSIELKLFGTFLPFEEIYISALTNRGIKVGPVRMTGTSIDIPQNKTKDELISFLREKRVPSISNYHNWTGTLTLPINVSRNEIVVFEIKRDIRWLNYTAMVPETKKHTEYEPFGLWFRPKEVEETVLTPEPISISPSELETEIGGPFIDTFSANLVGGKGGANYISGDFSHFTLPLTMSVPVIQLPPVLRYSQILQIEKTLQHIVRNTVKYSKSIWMSLTPEERVIMLEGFTIGVSSGGIPDPSQMVPLLNCVSNCVLGFYGNSMIMPFNIPPSLAESMELSTGKIQDILTKFHKDPAAFEPITTTVSLPTRGVLAEAVLGSCSSAEKIDLTRFWNWADSPADSAPEISSVTVPTTQPSTAAGLSGPNTLTGIQPLINNFNAGAASPASDTSLLQAMIKAGSDQKDFSTDLTGASLLAGLMKETQSTAESARADAMKTFRDQSEMVMAIVGNIVGARFGNPKAGSDSLSALQGNSGKDDKKDEKTPDKEKDASKETGEGTNENKGKTGSRGGK